VTSKNRWLSGALSIIIATQLCFGIYFIIGIARRPCKFLSRLFVRMRTHIGL
jgi:hypothetical protein